LEYFFGHYFLNVRILLILSVFYIKFFEGRIRPFDKLLQEMGNNSDVESFFHRLARIISAGRVLQYIYYQPEIPRNM
jgi:hypothetical protein